MDPRCTNGALAAYYRGFQGNGSQPIMRCEICLKSGMSGNNVSHSNRHTKTRFKANVHKQTVFQDGKNIKVKICSRCLRSVNKSPKFRKALAALAPK